MWKYMNYSLGHTLFFFAKMCCNKNGGNDILDYINISMIRIHFSLPSKFIVMLKVIHVPVMHCHIMKVVKMQWRILSCLQQFIARVLCWYTLYSPSSTHLWAVSIKTDYTAVAKVISFSIRFLFKPTSCLEQVWYLYIVNMGSKGCINSCFTETALSQKNGIAYFGLYFYMLLLIY